MAERVRNSPAILKLDLAEEEKSMILMSQLRIRKCAITRTQRSPAQGPQDNLPATYKGTFAQFPQAQLPYLPIRQTDH